MRLAVLATAAILAANSASAFDLGLGGLKAGGKIDSSYNVTQDAYGLIATPELGWEMYNLDMTVSTDIDVLALDEGADFTGLDYRAEFEVFDGLTAYGTVSSDEDWDFGDVVVGATFEF